MFRNTFVIVSIFSVISSYALADSGGEQPSVDWTEHYSKRYDFSFDNTFRSFIGNIPIWEKILRQFKGKPGIHYLEIGVNQGRSAMWVLENILTDPSAKLTGIDIFPEGTDFKKRYLSNLKLSGFAHKATTIEGFSQIELRKLPLNSFDIIYIDGDHRANGVLADAVLSFELLKTGGILIFDDYLWLTQLPEELRPEVAIDSFITVYRNSIEVVQRGYQVFVRKRKNPCDYFSIPPIGCSPVGQYVYVWNWDGGKELYQQDMSEPITLSDKEKQFIEELIKSTRFGMTDLFVNCTIAKDKDFINLTERLKLDFTNIEIEQERGFFEKLRRLFFPSSQY